MHWSLALHYPQAADPGCRRPVCFHLPRVLLSLRPLLFAGLARPVDRDVQMHLIIVSLARVERRRGGRGRQARPSPAHHRDVLM